MSRQRIPMKDGSLAVIGYDPPFKTWYALHYDDHDEDAPPRVAIGYSPAEQAILKAERPDAVIGPYPIGDDQVLDMLERMLPELGGPIFEPTGDQPMCWSCGKPPWESNPACAVHVFDSLRGRRGPEATS